MIIIDFVQHEGYEGWEGDAGKEKTFSSNLGLLAGALQIRLSKDRLTGEKQSEVC